jgi:hypothetical protein
MFGISSKKRYLMTGRYRVLQDREIIATWRFQEKKVRHAEDGSSFAKSARESIYRASDLAFANWQRRPVLGQARHAASYAYLLT